MNWPSIRVPQAAFQDCDSLGRDRALQTARDRNIGTPNSGHLYAMAGAGMYDAVNGIDSADGDVRSRALVSAAGAPAGANREAAYTVLSSFVPAAYRDTVLTPARTAELASHGAADPAVTAGRDWGASVGEQVVTLRSADGTQAAVNMPAGTGIGTARCLTRGSAT